MTNLEPSAEAIRKGIVTFRSLNDTGHTLDECLRVTVIAMNAIDLAALQKENERLKEANNELSTGNLANKTIAIFQKEAANLQQQLKEKEEGRLKQETCHVCGDYTQMACSDCRIDFQTTIRVCQKTSCRDEHEHKCSSRLRQQIAASQAECERLKAILDLDGHEEICHYCKKVCDSLSARASEWPIPLCHSDDPGVVKWHHIGCVSDRLDERDSLQAENAKLKLRYYCPDCGYAGSQPEHIHAGAKAVAPVDKMLDEERDENARLKEWRDSVLNKVKQIPEYGTGEWGGDKEGWGFVFELVGWQTREVAKLRENLKEAERLIVQYANEFPEVNSYLAKRTEK